MQGSPHYFRNYFIMKHHKRTGHLVMCENYRYENTTFRSFLVFSWYFWHPLICMVSWHFKREVEGGSFCSCWRVHQQTWKEDTSKQRSVLEILAGFIGDSFLGLY